MGLLKTLFLIYYNKKLNNKHNKNNNKQTKHSKHNSRHNKHNHTWYSTPKKARNPGHANHVLKTPTVDLIAPSPPVIRK